MLLRPSPEEEDLMKTRILVAIPIGLVLIAALVLQSWVLVALFAVLSFIAQAEMMRTLDAKGIPRCPQRALRFYRGLDIYFCIITALERLLSLSYCARWRCSAITNVQQKI